MKFKPMSAIAALALSVPTFAMADADDDTLVINGEIEIVTKAPAPAHLDGALDEVISGWHFRDDTTQAMEMDDFDNPGMIFVEQGVEIWNAVDGGEGKSCASCHGADHQGTRLSRVPVDRVLKDADGVIRATLAAGEIVSCGLCHSIDKSFED